MRHPALAAWTSEQLSERSLERLKAGDFCIRCPDNDVTRKLGERRIQWAAEDVIRNRPAFSPWRAE